MTAARRSQAARVQRSAGPRLAAASLAAAWAALVGVLVALVATTPDDLFDVCVDVD